MVEINVSPKNLYEGCIQAAITHAVAVGMYPELNYEHSWDGMNYCMNNSQGCKATITFHPECIIAVFQDVDKMDMDINALKFFDGASENIIQVAKSDALQYVLEEVDGEAKPVITAAFWGTWEQLFSTQSFAEVIDSGGYIIKDQLLPYNDASVQWQEYYDLDTKQLDLARRLFSKKVNSNGEQIELIDEDMQSLYGDIEECLISLGELNIFKKY